MNLLKRLLGGDNGIVEDYDYYVVQQRIGGLYGRWEEIDKRKDFLDKPSGIATYSDGSDMTLRCFGVRKFQDREIKKQLWITYSREDIEEEIEERKKRAGKKDRGEDDIEKYLKILNVAKDEEREKLESLVGMMNQFYENQFELFSGLQQQNSEANKYDVWREGIHEMGEIGKEIIQDLREGREDSGGEDEKETEKFEDYKRKALPPGSGEKGKNNGADKGKPGAALLLMAKYIEGSGDPVSYLETIAVAFPDVYQALLTVKSLEELLEKLKPHAKKLPVLAAEEAKEWLARMLEIISQAKAESEKSAPEKTGVEDETGKGD